VSRVLNNSPLVSAETRLRVMAAIEALDYKPSRTARSLSSGRTQHIGVLASFFTEPSTLPRLRGIVETVTPHGYDIVLYAVETNEQARTRLAELTRSTTVDGLIIVSLPVQDNEAVTLAAGRPPTVLVDSDSSRLPSVVIDDIDGGRMATEHLIGLGHERIAFIGDPPGNPFGFSSSRDREAGYRMALADADLPQPRQFVRHGAYGRSIAVRLAQELLELPNPPTAIVAASDTQGLGVIEAATRMGVAVPEQLSVIGFDDIEAAAYVGLSTVRQPLHMSGQRGAELLLEAIAGNRTGSVTEHLAIELVARRTTAPPAHLRRSRRRPESRGVNVVR
jgi:DNA-binding LacI/PurR family transcriptional regulator